MLRGSMETYIDMESSVMRPSVRLAGHHEGSVQSTARSRRSSARFAVVEDDEEQLVLHGAA